VLSRSWLSSVVSTAVLVVAVSVAGCAGSRGGASEPAVRVPVIVDTDLSSDDLIAIAVVARDPHMQLRAVTVSGTGLVTCPAGARLASDLLGGLGRGGVPVACGASVPVTLNGVLPSGWRTAADGMFGLEFPRNPVAPSGTAVSLLRREIGAGPPPTVVELAPMTNLAQALQGQPALAHRIHMIVAMGGALTVPGNAPGDPAAETNIWLDPGAADSVLRSGARVLLVPLDATNRVPVTSSVSGVLRRYHWETPAATIAWDTLLATTMDRGGSYFWDPLTALAVTDPALLRTAGRRVAVLTHGRTILSTSGAAVRVATGADRRAFERALLGTLLGGRPYAASATHADATITYTGTRCRYTGVRRIVTRTVVVDTENRSSRPFTWIAGRLDPGHSFAELARWALDPRHAGTAPPWFVFDASGDTPPHSGMTWQAYLPTGSSGTTIVGCGTPSPPRAWLLARIAVFASGP
jgi:inosine-uridine nucleoside N-ribohydrolase